MSVIAPAGRGTQKQHNDRERRPGEKLSAPPEALGFNPESMPQQLLHGLTK